MRMLVFGDSIAQGYYDIERGGWVSLLFLDVLARKVRHTDYPTELFNVSVSGDTIKRITARLEAEASARKWADEPVLLIFAVGINDTLLDNGQPLSSPEQYADDLKELYAVASKITDQLFFVGLTSVDEAESAPWKFNTGSHELSWRNDRIAKFDAVLQSFADQKRVGYVPVFEHFQERQAAGDILHADGLHPSAAGHRLIYEQVKQYLAGY